VDGSLFSYTRSADPKRVVMVVAVGEHLIHVERETTAAA
jgi:hypothetical protein